MVAGIETVPLDRFRQSAAQARIIKEQHAAEHRQKFVPPFVSATRALQPDRVFGEPQDGARILTQYDTRTDAKGTDGT